MKVKEIIDLLEISNRVEIYDKDGSCLCASVPLDENWGYSQIEEFFNKEVNSLSTNDWYTLTITVK